jgi:hypothetical protein
VRRKVLEKKTKVIVLDGVEFLTLWQTSNLCEFVTDSSRVEDFSRILVYGWREQIIEQ